MSLTLNSPCINHKSVRRTCNLGVVVHFNLEKINKSIKLLRNPIYNHIYVKKTLYAIFSSVFQKIHLQVIVVGFQKASSPSQGPTTTCPPPPPPRRSVVEVALLALVPPPLANNQHQHELPPPTSTDWLSQDPRRRSQLSVLQGKEAERVGNTGRQLTLIL